jgi:hypothetical protein
MIDQSTASPTGANSCNTTVHWAKVSNEFLNAVTWVSAIAWRGAVLPTQVPEEIIDVYLSDSEAVPLHDCGSCGLAIPVRPSRLYGLDGDPERVYFSLCPACGSRTGPHMYFTRRFEDNISDTLRRRPR